MDAIYMVLLCMIALTVVMMMRVVGLIMVIAMLTMPAAISGQFVKDMKQMMIALQRPGRAVYHHRPVALLRLNLTSGASIILVSGVAYMLSLLGKSIAGRRRPPVESSV